MLHYFKKNIFPLAILLNITLFLILLAQNPFSDKSILSDLYLYPDTIHYINPAVNIFKGAGFRISREGRSIAAEVPPLYSIVLIPAYLISHDPRMFYFINIVLSLTSAFLFFLVLKLVANNKLIMLFVFFLYISNFFIDWYPKLAMAENLALLIFLGGLYLLFTKISHLKLILAGILGVSLLAAKYALAPVSISFFVLYASKIWLEKGSHKTAVKTKIGRFLIFFITGLTVFSLFIFSENLYKSYNLFYKSQYLLKPLASTAVSSTNATVSAFSFSHLHDSFVQYLAGLLGGPVEFAGFYRQPVPIFVGMLGLPVLFYGLALKKRCFACFCLIITAAASIVFMSTFKVVDGRYIYHVIPILLLGFAIFLEEAKQFLTKNSLNFVYLGLISGLFTYYLIISAGRLSTQVFENLNGDKTPLNYNTVVGFNRFFQKNPQNTDNKPVVITDLIPYFVDLYGNGNYRVLPLATIGFFMNQAALVWGPQDDYHNLFAVYDSYLKRGFDVYVSDSGIYYWNKKFLLQNFMDLREKYNLFRVSVGCSGECILYKLQIK